MGMSKESERYEQVTRAILEQCREQLGFKEVRPKSKIPGKTGTRWEIDATCYRVESEGMILVECRRHTTRKIDQEQVAGLVFRIRDTGAEGGLVVTPLGFQEGAELVAKACKVTMATLNPNATEREYVLRIAEQLFIGVSAVGASAVPGGVTVTIGDAPKP